MTKIVGDWTTDVRMTDDEAKAVCRLGQLSACCAYLAVDGKGFSCLRMTELSAIIMGRLRKGAMDAKGEGGWKGCAWEGVIPEHDMSGPDGPLADSSDGYKLSQADVEAEAEK